MTRSIALLVACAVPVLAVAGAAVAGPDFNPPGYRGLPNSTTQGWDFIFGFATEPQFADSRVAPLRNPNFLFPEHVPGITEASPPAIISVSRQVTSQPNIGDAFMTLLGNEPGQNPARLALAIPDFATDAVSYMRIQLTYRIAALPRIDFLQFNGSTRRNDIIESLVDLTDRVDPERGNWRQATLDIQFSHNPQYHILLFTNESGLPLDIESIVIDTIAPAPGAAVMLGCGGLLLAHRRRRA